MIRVYESRGKCALENLVHVDTATVVAHPDHDRRSFPRSRQGQLCRGGLAGNSPLRRRFHTVVQRVTQQMHDGFTDLIENRLVDLDVGPENLEHNLLSQGLRSVAHHSLEALERLADRNHARSRDLSLQTADEP